MVVAFVFTMMWHQSSRPRGHRVGRGDGAKNWRQHHRCERRQFPSSHHHLNLFSLLLSAMCAQKPRNRQNRRAFPTDRLCLVQDRDARLQEKRKSHPLPHTSALKWLPPPSENVDKKGSLTSSWRPVPQHQTVSVRILPSTGTLQSSQSGIRFPEAATRRSSSCTAPKNHDSPRHSLHPPRQSRPVHPTWSC
jgi:hypothetical protein